jgi:hypothetical protein
MRERPLPHGSPDPVIPGMNPILVVALVCASTVQAPDCSRETALDIITGPAHTLQECLVQGPVLAASAGRGSAENTYVKTRCEPRR